MKPRSAVDYWAIEAVWAMAILVAADSIKGRHSIWRWLMISRIHELEARLAELTIQHAEREMRQD